MYYYVCNLHIINNFNFDQIKNLKQNNRYSIPKINFEKITSKIEDYEFDGQIEINGSTLKHLKSNKKETNFRLRTGSGLAFIETDKELEKIDAMTILNSQMGAFVRLTDFVPHRDKVKEFVLSSKSLEDIKLFTGGGIQSFEVDDSVDIKNKLSEYSLIEAELEFNIKEEEINFYYYGDALQFPLSIEKEQIEKIIQVFEVIMSNKSLKNSNNLKKPSKCVNHVFC